ncbi:MAG: hypothetical protein Q4E46_01050 [Candidatus Saccharibacteria bacterium]|nr:hypothetical protein [Candidatus Saccharibacteria bacterium]
MRFARLASQQKRPLVFGLVFATCFIFGTYFSESAFALSCGSNTSTQNACDLWGGGVARGAAWLTTDTANKSNAAIYYKGDLAGLLPVTLYGAVYKGSGGSANNVRILTSAVSSSGMSPTGVASQRTVHGAFTDFTGVTFYRGSGSSDNGFSTGWESGGVTRNVNLDYIKSSMSPNCGDGCYIFTVHLYRCFGSSYNGSPGSCYSDPVQIRIEPDPSEPVSNTYNFASKSGVGYNNRNQTFSALNGRTDQNVTLSYNTQKVTVNFTQRIYLKLDGRAPNSFNPIVDTTHKITSSTSPKAAEQGNTKLTSQAAGWKQASEAGYYYQDVKTSDLEVTVPETGSVKVCQKIDYNHKNITVTNGSASYSGNGSSEACITFSRSAKPPDPPENYCEGKNIYSINRGDTYGWSQVTNLNTDKTENTMKANKDSVFVYARPGDTVTFAHAFCYGAQAVRSTNGVYTTDYSDAARTSFVNLFENTFSIYGTTRIGSKGASGYSASYGTTGTADYGFGKFNNATTVSGRKGVVAAGNLQILANASNAAKLYQSSTKNPAELPLKAGSNPASRNVNNIGTWGFYVESPWGLTNELKCSGAYYKDAFMSGGYQIHSFVSGGNCERFSTASTYGKGGSSEVGKGIAQRITYKDVKNWIKEAHRGTQDSTYWCKCNPRHVYHADTAPWKEYDSRDNNQYKDFEGVDHKNDAKSVNAGDWDKDRTGTQDTAGPPKKESTKSIYNIDPVSFNDYNNSQYKAGWVDYKCATNPSKCKDTWTENAATKDEITTMVGTTYMDSDKNTTSPIATGYDNANYSSRAADEQWDWYTYCPNYGSGWGNRSCYDYEWDDEGCWDSIEKEYYGCDVREYESANSVDWEFHYYYCSNSGNHLHGSECRYNFNCDGLHEGFPGRYLSWETCVYNYYHCTGDTWFDGPAPGSTDARYVERPNALTCYRHRYACSKTTGYGDTVYGGGTGVVDGYSYNYSQSICRWHHCPSRTSRNNRNTDEDKNDVASCSYCDNEIRNKWPQDTETGVLVNVNAYKVPSEGIYTVNKDNGASSGGGCQFNVNIRDNFQVQTNKVKYTTTNNKTAQAGVTTPVATDVTKTAEVLVPYNYYITTSSRISSASTVYLGEDIQFNFDAKVNPRINAAVDPNESYATYTLENGTKFQAIQFIVSPSEKASFTGKVAANWNGTDLCAAFGRTSANCKEFAASTTNDTLNKDGNPRGAVVLDQNTWQTATVPDDNSVEVGSLYCVAVGAYPGGSHGKWSAPTSGTTFNSTDGQGSGMSHFDDAVWALSDASCRTIAKKANFQVWNGGLYTEAGVYTSVSNKAPNWALNPSAAANKVVFGSWDEYGVTANGSVYNFASGAAMGYATTRNYSQYYNARGIQTISNSNNDDLGHSNVTGVSPGNMLQKILSRYTGTPVNNSFPTYGADKQLGGSSGNSNAYYYELSGGATINTTTISSGTHVIRVNGNVTINGNICIGTGTCASNPNTLVMNQRNTQNISNISDIPQVIIIANNITIAENVTQVDAWLIAANTAGTSVSSYGKIDTCNVEISATDTNAANKCKRTLMINGPVIANELSLDRTAGALQGGAKFNNSNLPAQNLADDGSATPAEIFNLRPDVYLWAYSQLNRFTQATTTYSRELAPRY